MIRLIRTFVAGLLAFPKPWRIWLAALLLVNMVLPVVFFATIEGKVVLGCMLAGASAQMVLLSRLGFVRLLGIGHVIWIPMVLWLWERLPLHEVGKPLYYWIAATIAIDSISLVLDAIDVGRWLGGDRATSLMVGDV